MEHFEETVWPCLQESKNEMFSPNVYNKDSFLWAASVLDTHGVTINTSMIGKRGKKVRIVSSDEEKCSEEVESDMEDIEDDDEGESRFGVLVTVLPEGLLA
jgi:hypothetical protein